MATLDQDETTPRRFVGNMDTRLVHRTDTDDEACIADADHRLVFSDSLERLMAQEWSTYVHEDGPFLEGETPAQFNLAKDATTRRHSVEVMRKFVLCPMCKPGGRQAREVSDGA